MDNSDNFFPLFINLKNKNILVIGAGKIAFRKVSTVLEYQGSIKVLTNRIADPRFNDLSTNKLIDLQVGTFNKEYLKKECLNSFLVILATDNENLNEELYMYCDEHNILVNNITSKTLMNTRFASVLKEGGYIIGISANGDPKKSKALKNKLHSLDIGTIL
jgi:precorrin-2 dehydrogenase/sirohydrochlorin ferrochelatase